LEFVAVAAIKASAAEEADDARRDARQSDVEEEERGVRHVGEHESPLRFRFEFSSTSLHEPIRARSEWNDDKGRESDEQEPVNVAPTKKTLGASYVEQGEAEDSENTRDLDEDPRKPHLPKHRLRGGGDLPRGLR